MDAFQQAVAFVKTALYENGAAKDVALALKSGERMDSLAEQAYKIVEIVDERTDGAVPDEQIALLAAEILEDVADIGEAAGIDYTPQEIAGAMRLMIVRFLQEQGLDTRELEAAMDQVDPAEFDKMGEE